MTETNIKDKNKKHTTKFKPLLIKHNPVVDLTKGKSTAVYLDFYYIPKGDIITRAHGNRKLIGYCTENPLEVLKITFPEYHITRFHNYSFFSSEYMESTTPMCGLYIKQIDPMYGTEGKIEKLLGLEDIIKAKRDKPISKRDVKKIIDHINNTFFVPVFHSQYKQREYNKKQIIDVLKQYGE